MKKLIFSLAVLAFAGVAQADYLWWSVKAADIDKFDDADSARVGYVLTGSGLLSKGTVAASMSSDGDWSTTDGIELDGSSGALGLDGYAYKVDLSAIENASSYSYYIEILNESGQVVARSTSNNAYTEYSKLSNYIATGEITSDIPVTAYIWHGGSFQAVPEPSSMALLALGAGLVGLRRKLKKGKKEKRA